MILAAWLHNIDPVAIGPVRWYGLSYVLGFAIGYYAIKRVAAVGVSTVKPQQVMDLVVALAFGIMIGGRLGYVLFYQPELLWRFTDRIPFWGVLAIHEGGMASHGGMIGGVLATVIFARRWGHSGLFVLDLFAFGAPLGLFFGRIANFINGELYGRACAETYVFAMKFPQEIADWSSACYGELLDALPPPGTVVPPQTVWDVPTITAFVQRGNGAVIGALEPLLTPRHPSQIYQALLDGLAVFVVLLIVWRRPRRPGVVAATFMMTYGVFRIIGEFFREPDRHIAHLEASALGITRGQLLSILMIIAGVVLFWIVHRRPAGPVGSWRAAG